jgi:FkbM family methyltransferase
MPGEVRDQVSAALQRAEHASTDHRAARSLRHRLRVALARLASSDVTCTIFTGQRVRVVIPELVGTQIYLYGIIEPSVSHVMLEHLRPGMVCFDVGAQYGYHSLVASLLVGPTGGVVAFEPGRHACGLLLHNLAHVNHAVVECRAVGETSGTVDLHDFGDRHSAVNTTLSSARIPPRERATLHADRYAVPQTSIDDYVEATGAVPDFIKLDAEGAEHAIINGMQTVLRNASPMLSVETGDYDGMDAPSSVSTIRALERAGYLAYEFDGRLRRHRMRDRYGYGNLFFRKAN